MKIESGSDVRAARELLGWSVYQLAAALRMTADNGARRIREFEAGTRDIPGPTSLAIEALVDGFRPQG